MNQDTDTAKAKLWAVWKASGVTPYDAAEMFRMYEHIGCWIGWFSYCLLTHYSHYKSPERYTILYALHTYHLEISNGK